MQFNFLFLRVVSRYFERSELIIQEISKDFLCQDLCMFFYNVLKNRGTRINILDSLKISFNLFGFDESGVVILINLDANIKYFIVIIDLGLNWLKIYLNILSIHIKYKINFIW